MDSATQQQKEIIVGGMLSKSGGNFSIENIPLFGKYTLKVTGIGYKTYEQSVAFQLPNRNAQGNNGAGNDPGALLGAIDKDLGNIKLQIDDKLLSNVTVTSSKPLVQMGIDRKVFNVEQNIVSAGGSAVDVLKNVPSISVDIDGNVSLRNSAPQIFVDGRPTTMTLDQIPADAIESVEVITNPSAKFDASGGTAGILNIVLKKNKRVGYSGNIRTNVDSRGKIGFGGNANMRQNKVNLFAMGNYNQRKSIGTGETERTETLNGITQHSLQKDRSEMEGSFRFGRAGLDYFIDNRNTLTISGSMVKGTMKPATNSDIFSNKIFPNSVSDSFNQRFTNATNEFRNWGAQAGFKHNFPKTGHEWTADVNYNNGRNSNINTIKTDNYKMPGNNYTGTSVLQQIGGGDNKNLVVQTDYVNPITENSKLEMGARASIRDVKNATNYYTLENGVALPRANQNIDYESKDREYAAYANFSNRIKNFGYQVGLRAESSSYDGMLINKNQPFKIDFPISLFPSVFLSEKLNDQDEMQFNYSRRINRPGFWQLTPFYDLTDPLNISRGNLSLKPEFTNSFELSYSRMFKNRDNFLASAYFKNTNNLITRIQAKEYVEAIDSQTLVLSYINANKSYVTGLELTARNKITRWWELTSNANFYTSKIDLKDVQDPKQFLSYFLRLNNNFKLPKNFSIQLSGDYDSRRLVVGGGGGMGGGRGGFGGGFGGASSSAQGYIRPQYSVDAAVRYDFLKDKAASISLGVNDLFKTRKYDAHTETDYFIQDAYRIRDQQIFRLNFNWRFGKFDASLFKRKNTKAENNDQAEGF
jgi:outer membrane receptor protein involved in Fe transport